MQELKAKLEKCEVVNEEFKFEGKFYINGAGGVDKGSGTSDPMKAYYNYWKDEETAKTAVKLQRRHNAMMNYVSQKQQLGKGDWIVFKNDLMEWRTYSNGLNYFPDMVTMFQSTAIQMIEDIESGYFKLDEL